MHCHATAQLNKYLSKVEAQSAFDYECERVEEELLCGAYNPARPENIIEALSNMNERDMNMMMNIYKVPAIKNYVDDYWEYSAYKEALRIVKNME